MLNKIKYFIARYDFKKISSLLRNSGWIFFDKIFRVAAGLFVGIWIARYLGPEKFGIINYVAVFPLLFSAISGLGLTNILYNEFITNKDESHLKDLFTTSILSKLVSGFLCVILTIIISSIIDKDKFLIALVAISSINLVAQSSDVVDTYFQSQRKVQYSIVPKLTIFIIASIFRVLALLGKYDIIFFVLINSFEQIISSLTSLVIFARFTNLKITDFKFHSPILYSLLKRSWPLMISELFLFLYTRVNLLMLKHFSADSELGNYSVAVRMTDLWYFIPIALTASLYPSIIALRQSNYEEYLNRYRYMLSSFALLSICIALVLTFAANPIVYFLYGKKYIDVGSVLTISIWTGLFVFLDIGISNWFITESLQKFVLQRTIVGAFINVALNFILIPSLGAVGASIATLIAQICASYLINGLYSKAKEAFMLQTYALLFLPRFVNKLIRKTY